MSTFYEETTELVFGAPNPLYFWFCATKILVFISTKETIPKNYGFFNIAYVSRVVEMAQ